MVSELGPYSAGVEVIYGCMFSGKTEELIRRITRAKSEGLLVALFKPALDKRYHAEHIVSHDHKSLPGRPLLHSDDLIKHFQGESIVGIDEIQFFDPGIVEVCRKLVLQKTRVIVAGLDLDFRGHPFGPMPSLLEIAGKTTQLLAVCESCGGEATHTFRKSRVGPLIITGESDLYEARCSRCFEEGMQAKA